MSEYRITVDLSSDLDESTAEDIRVVIAGMYGVDSADMSNLTDDKD
jgi:cell division protein FtsX